ncbi:hypothetical protein ACFTZB_41500 [Rhodococcus sp. NPDC057014]|uniref:hypothetical protein n=1 Tax=Rhodococcus sp. NPDC057014 TaxID=3346000 RepID=UPI0036363625
MAADSADAFCDDDQTDDRLARAAIEALQAGRSWAHIAKDLGVSPPAVRDRIGVTDREWQDAIVAHENARAARLDDPSWVPALVDGRPSGESYPGLPNLDPTGYGPLLPD